MKRSGKFVLFCCAAFAALFCSCTKENPGFREGENVVFFDTKALVEEASKLGLKESEVDAFRLMVSDVSGVVYDGPFGERPDTVRVRAGLCSFALSSREYGGPVADSPVWGDYKELEISAGEPFCVTLTCRQLTCGVQILFSEEFKIRFPEGFVRISRTDTVSSEVENYDYRPSGTGFVHFLPGVITVNLMKDAESAPELLTGKICEPSDMLSVTVKIVSDQSAGKIMVVVDTALVRYAATYEYGRKREGKTLFDAVGVSEIAHFADDTVWVVGYVTGCYVNKKWHPGIDEEVVTSNISLSNSPDVSYPALVTIPVSVATGKCKLLNLKEHPEMLGRRVAVFGLAGRLYDKDAVKKSFDYSFL